MHRPPAAAAAFRPGGPDHGWTAEGRGARMRESPVQGEARWRAPRDVLIGHPNLEGGTMTTASPQETLSGVAEGSAPVLEQLAEMHLNTLERSRLDETTYHLVRLAALVAMDAAPVSYLINLGVAAEAAVTLE